MATARSVRALTVLAAGIGLFSAGGFVSACGGRDSAKLPETVMECVPDPSIVDIYPATGEGRVNCDILTFSVSDCEAVKCDIFTLDRSFSTSQTITAKYAGR